MSIKATTLRQNLYQILDKILETGEPVEIMRKGEILTIVHRPKKKISKLSRLEKHDTINGKFEDIIDVDWSSEWNEEKNLAKIIISEKRKK